MYHVLPYRDELRLTVYYTVAQLQTDTLYLLFLVKEVANVENIIVTISVPRLDEQVSGYFMFFTGKEQSVAGVCHTYDLNDMCRVIYLIAGIYKQVVRTALSEFCKGRVSISLDIQLSFPVFVQILVKIFRAERFF